MQTFMCEKDSGNKNQKHATRAKRGKTHVSQSTVRKKMAAVNFTRTPCEPNRAISTHRKPYFGEIHPCTNKIVYARFEVFRPFLCVFMSDL